VRRVSQRPRSAYSSANQSAAVATGSFQADVNRNQRIFVSGSMAESSRAAPTAHGTMQSTRRTNGRVPGAGRRRQA